MGKACSKCKIVQPLKDFYEDGRARDGKQSGCKACYGWYWKLDRERNPTKYTKQTQARFLKYRLTILNHYGGECACCGEKHWQFLTIDHIGGGGHRHRKEIGIWGGSAFYKWIIDNDFPGGYQILCWNCNCAKKHRAACPHQLENGLETTERAFRMLRVKELIKKTIKRSRCYDTRPATAHA